MEMFETIWHFVSLAVKVLIYVTYFFPLIGARVLQYFDLWPTLWPFTPLV